MLGAYSSFYGIQVLNYSKIFDIRIAFSFCFSFIQHFFYLMKYAQIMVQFKNPHNKIATKRRHRKTNTNRQTNKQTDKQSNKQTKIWKQNKRVFQRRCLLSSSELLWISVIERGTLKLSVDRTSSIVSLNTQSCMAF